MHYHHYTLQFPAQLLQVLHAIGIGLAQLLLTDVFFFFVQSLSTTLTIVAGDPVVEKDRSTVVTV